MQIHRPMRLLVWEKNPKEVEVSIYECMVDGADAEKSIVKTDIKFLDLLPSHIDPGRCGSGNGEYCSA